MFTFPFQVALKNKESKKFQTWKYQEVGYGSGSLPASLFCADLPDPKKNSGKTLLLSTPGRWNLIWVSHWRQSFRRTFYGRHFIQTKGIVLRRFYQQSKRHVRAVFCGRKSASPGKRQISFLYSYAALFPAWQHYLLSAVLTAQFSCRLGQNPDFCSPVRHVIFTDHRRRNFRQCFAAH